MSKFNIYLDYSGSMFGIGKDSVLINSLRSIMTFANSKGSFLSDKTLNYFKVTEEVLPIEIDDQQRIRWPVACKKANIQAFIEHVKQDETQHLVLLTDGQFSFKEKKQISNLLEEYQGHAVMVLIGPDADGSGFGWAKNKVIYPVGNLEQALNTANYGFFESSLNIHAVNSIEFAESKQPITDDWDTPEDDWDTPEDDWDTELMLNQSWSYIRQSVTGPAHLKAGLPNQDYTLGCIFHQGMAIAVADGLGSKNLSHLGSKAACESVKSAAQFVIKNKIRNEKVIPRIVHAFWCAKLADYDLSQCSTTLNYAIIYEDDCFLGKLGDGMILIDQYSAPALLFDRDDEDSFSNLTNSLSHRFDLAEWQTQKIPIEHIKMIFMCTDGISDDLLANQKISFAQELLSTCQKTTKSAQTRFTKKILKEWPVIGHSDDKSFIFAFKREL